MSKYNLTSLPTTQHYEIVVAFNAEVKRDTYYAKNRVTGILEVPFNISGHAQQVLEDLEDEYTGTPKEVH